MELLEELPGVGHKTASVVMCQAFGQPAFPVDTHIHRLAQRWGLTNGKNVEQTERDLKKLFPESSWNKLHLQIIYYGREHCTHAHATVHIAIYAVRSIQAPQGSRDKEVTRRPFECWPFECWPFERWHSNVSEPHAGEPHASACGFSC